MRTLGIPVHSRLMGRVGIRTWRHRHIFNINLNNLLWKNKQNNQQQKNKAQSMIRLDFLPPRRVFSHLPFPSHTHHLCHLNAAHLRVVDQTPVRLTDLRPATPLRGAGYLHCSHLPSSKQVSFSEVFFFIISNSFHLTSNWALWQRGWSSSICTCSLANRGSAGRSLH